ncbi:MAG: hypothetical protein Q9226_001613 [Calogaya cf. arnoldii]
MLRISKLRDHMFPKTTAPPMGYSPSPLALRAVTYTYFGVICVHIVSIATFAFICYTDPGFPSNDDKVLEKALWYALFEIFNLALVRPLWYFLTWILLRLYCRHPNWFPGLMALDPWMDREKKGGGRVGMGRGRSVEKGGDLV